MKLNDAKLGSIVCVKKVDGDDASRKHLLDMGLIPGTLVKIIKYAPMGDPIEIRLHNYELAIRKDQAALISVEKSEIKINDECPLDCADGAVEPLTAEELYTLSDNFSCHVCKNKCSNCINRQKYDNSDETVEHPGFGEDGIYHDKKSEKPVSDDKTLRFALVGNQNAGKTTLFNVLTGSNQHVGNFPGVTVDRKDGAIKGHANTQITDLPGIYSLSPYTKEEIVSREFVLAPGLDCIINIVDATSIERSLNLTMQLLELDVPVVVALNMMDEVHANHGTIHINTLEQMLGTPVVPISAVNNEGVDELIDHAIHIAKFHEEPLVQDFCLNDDKGGAVHRAIHSVMHGIEDHCKRANISPRFAATKLLEGDKHIAQLLKLADNEKQSIELIAKEMEDSSGLDREAAISEMRFKFIDKVCSACVVHGTENKQRTRSEKADRILTGKYTGIPAFILIMTLVFLISFNWIGSYLQGIIALGFDYLSDAISTSLATIGASDVINSFLVDGVMQGVGSVLSFLPLIVVMFFFLSLLEDSGYMARVAFVMDKLLRKIGLSGRSIIPMLIGFGCSVPAIMSARTLPSKRDRKLAVLLTPYMSCSAKLPIYSFISVIFFPKIAGLVIVLMYLLGIVVGIIVALFFKRGANPVPFIMELPNYRLPSPANVGRLLWQKCKDFLKKAFTIILVATIIIWFLQSFNFSLGLVEDASQSMLATLAGVIAPLFAPLGLADWRIVTSLITGLLAKETVISTMAVTIGASAQIATSITALSALALMVFCLLYTPCVATISCIKSEMGWPYAVGIVVFQCIVAWVVAFIVTLIGTGILTLI